MNDVLDPERDLFCISCLCQWQPTDITDDRSPGEECLRPLCDCHQSFWATVPELEKRRLWGDR